MKIGILGAGNAGIALYALMLNDSGFDPIIWSAPGYLHTFEKLTSTERDVKFFYGHNEEPANIPRSRFQVTNSIKSLLGKCEYIVNTLPINAHIDVFNAICNALRKEKRRITLINFSGGFAIFDHLSNHRDDDLVTLVSAHTLPYASRVCMGEIRILNRRNETLVSLEDDAPIKIVKILEELMGTPLIPERNHLRCAIDRSSYVMHPLITMMNFTRLEKGERWFFYRDGFSESVKRLLVETGYERQSLCQKLGFADFISPEERIRRFSETYMDEFANVLPPKSTEHRFFVEDIPYGLVFLCTLGQMVGVSMPLCESLVNITSSLCGKDFWTSPLNLLKNRSIADEVLRYRVSSSNPSVSVSKLA